MGSKLRVLKSLAKRHQSRNFQTPVQAKVEKDQLEILPEKEKDAIPSFPESIPVETPSLSVSHAENEIAPVVVVTATEPAEPIALVKSTEENFIPEVVTSIAQSNELNALASLSLTHQIHQSFGFAGTTETEATKPASGNKKALTTLKRTKAENKKSTVIAAQTTSADASEKSTGNWIFYFAFSQAFLALILGLKQIFGMLETPSDAGSKAVSISYATIGILGIHALLLIALAKNYFL